MRITAVTTTPLAVPFVQPYHWRSGVQRGANLVLFGVETDVGVTGYGESICEEPAAVESYGALMARAFVGRSLGDVEARSTATSGATAAGASRHASRSRC